MLLGQSELIEVRYDVLAEQLQSVHYLGVLNWSHLIKGYNLIHARLRVRFEEADAVVRVADTVVSVFD